MNEIALKSRRATYLIFALLATGPLVGCGDPGIFDRVETTGEAPANADWPRLADTPTPPPAGVYDDAGPDPAAGAAVRETLAASAETAASRSERLAGPVE